MRINRYVAAAVTTGMLGIAPLATTAPAHATENHTVTVTASPSAPAVVYGSEISVSVTTSGSDGRSYPGGTTTLFEQRVGSSTWDPVATAEPGYSFYDVKPKMNSAYKVVYSGYTAASEYENNYAPAESLPFSVQVQRNVTIKKAKARLTIKGKVAPKYKRKKVKILRKKGKRYVKYRTVRTNKKSSFKVRLPAARRGGRIYFKIVIPGNKQYMEFNEVWYTYSYRTPMNRAVIKN